MTNEQLSVAIARVEVRVDEMAADIHEIKEALVGNGSRPGLVERVAVNDQRITGVEARVLILETAPKRDGTGLSTTKLLGIMASMAAACAGLVELLSKLL
jgi:hypothetical protein